MADMKPTAYGAGIETPLKRIHELAPMNGTDVPSKAITPQKRADEKKMAVRSKLHAMLMDGDQK